MLTANRTSSPIARGFRSAIDEPNFAIGYLLVQAVSPIAPNRQAEIIDRAFGFVFVPDTMVAEEIDVTPFNLSYAAFETEGVAMDNHTLPSRFGTLAEEEADELLWQQEFRDNWDVIAAMADKALQDYQQGRTVPLERVLTGDH